MEEEKKKISVAALLAVGGLLVGGAIGYVYGATVGATRGVALGRSEILAEQAEAEKARLAEIQQAANPFSEAKDAANPFKDAYKNPFAP